MSRDHQQQSDPGLERRLRELVQDSVADVEPDDRLGEIRARVSRPARRRPALVALGGSVLAAAAVVTAVALVGPQLLGEDRPDSTDSPAASGPATGTASPTEAGEPTGMPMATRTLAGYYLGDTPTGVRLYREFRSVQTADDGPGESLALLTSEPADPDYRTLWPEGAFAGAEVGDDTITVELADTALLDRPEGVSEESADASVQQVVYTLQAYAGQRLPVEFVTADGLAERVLGTTYAQPVATRAPLDALSRVSLSDPGEGMRITDRVLVRGVASSNEGNVPWELRVPETGEIVESGALTANGFIEERLYAFSRVLNFSDVAPGTYVLTVTTDPTAEAGEQSAGASVTYSDTRTVVVE